MSGQSCLPRGATGGSAPSMSRSIGTKSERDGDEGDRPGEDRRDDYARGPGTLVAAFGRGGWWDRSSRRSGPSWGVLGGGGPGLGELRGPCDRRAGRGGPCQPLRFS